MTTPIANNGAARTQTINMDPVTVPPPRTPAAGGAAPPRGVSPVRDEFNTRAGTTNGAQAAVSTSAPLSPERRAAFEAMRPRVERMDLPEAQPLPVSRPRTTLAQTTERQHDAAAHYMRREGLLSVVGVIAHGTPLELATTVLSAGARTLDHMAEGESVPRALGHAARDIVIDQVGHLLEGHSPLANDPGLRLGGTGLVQGGVATFEAAAHIRQDMNERVRVAQQESAYNAAVAQRAEQDSTSRSLGRIAANSIGTASWNEASTFEALRNNRSFAIAFRQEIDLRLQAH